MQGNTLHLRDWIGNQSQGELRGGSLSPLSFCFPIDLLSLHFEFYIRINSFPIAQPAQFCFESLSFSLLPHLCSSLFPPLNVHRLNNWNMRGKIIILSPWIVNTHSIIKDLKVNRITLAQEPICMIICKGLSKLLIIVRLEVLGSSCTGAPCNPLKTLWRAS